MKIAVSTYSFQRLINAGGMSQLDCIRQAREMGFDGVEIMELFSTGGMEREEYAGRIGLLVQKPGFSGGKLHRLSRFSGRFREESGGGGDPGCRGRWISPPS